MLNFYGISGALCTGYIRLPHIWHHICCITIALLGMQGESNFGTILFFWHVFSHYFGEVFTTCAGFSAFL
jgi:hypothetical protein